MIKSERQEDRLVPPILQAIQGETGTKESLLEKIKEFSKDLESLSELRDIQANQVEAAETRCDQLKQALEQRLYSQKTFVTQPHSEHLEGVERLLETIRNDIASRQFKKAAERYDQAKNVLAVRMRTSPAQSVSSGLSTSQGARQAPSVGLNKGKEHRLKNGIS